MTDLTAPVLEARQLFKTFANQTALSEISWQLVKASITALLGPNGAGKTTLLKCLCGLYIPDQGHLYCRGRLVEWSRDRGFFHYVSAEDGGFYPRLTARENLHFFGNLYQLKAAVIRERISAAQDLFQLEKLDKPYQQYSTGVKHRIALMRALLQPAGILLLDEPTRSLDPQMRGHFHDFIAQYRTLYPEASVVMATHDLDLAESLSDHILILKAGNIIAADSMSTVKNRFQNIHQYYETKSGAFHVR